MALGCAERKGCRATGYEQQNGPQGREMSEKKEQVSREGSKPTSLARQSLLPPLPTPFPSFRVLGCAHVFRCHF